jgi:hypothetical protein
LQNQINFFLTFQKNYLAGELIQQVAPFIIGSMIDNFINQDVINFNNFINEDITNEHNAVYGIGVGELFICVGL